MLKYFSIVSIIDLTNIALKLIEVAKCIKAYIAYEIKEDINFM